MDFFAVYTTLKIHIKKNIAAGANLFICGKLPFFKKDCFLRRDVYFNAILSKFLKGF